MSAEIRSSGLFVLGAWRFTFDSEGILDQAPNCFGASRPQPLPDAVLAHENCRVSIVEQITGEVRQLRNEFAGNVGMTVGRGAWRRFTLPTHRAIYIEG